MVKRLRARLIGNSSLIRKKEAEIQRLADDLDKGMLSWSELFNTNPKFYSTWYKIMGVELEEYNDKT